MSLCEYGCGKESNYKLNNKFCCEDKWQKCPAVKIKIKKSKNFKKIKKVGMVEYKKWKEEVLKRDGYKCQLCDEVENLEIISIYTDSYLTIVPEYGITLCQKHLSKR